MLESEDKDFDCDKYVIKFSLEESEKFRQNFKQKMKTKKEPYF